MQRPLQQFHGKNLNFSLYRKKHKAFSCDSFTSGSLIVIQSQLPADNKLALKLSRPLHDLFRLHSVNQL